MVDSKLDQNSSGQNRDLRSLVPEPLGNYLMTGQVERGQDDTARLIGDCIATLQDTNQRIRTENQGVDSPVSTVDLRKQQAAEILGLLNHSDSTVLSTLGQTVLSFDNVSEVRAASMEALLALDPTLGTQISLIAIRREESPDLSEAMLGSLAKANVAEAAAEAIEMTAHPEAMMRLCGLEVLKDYFPSLAKQEAKKLASDPDGSVRTFASMLESDLYNQEPAGPVERDLSIMDSVSLALTYLDDPDSSAVKTARSWLEANQTTLHSILRGYKESQLSL